jgi:flagellar hook assembly protein FlgD
MNFPNPFNLKSKSVNLQNATPTPQTITGTMIKISVPTAMVGEAQIQIFNSIGEKVRTLSTSIATGGTYNYLEWDGKNDHGESVASGLYIGRLTVAGSNEKFFKMAVLK